MGHYFTNENLPSNINKTNCFVLGKKFVFFTDNGVFSKTGLDFGSRFLLESIPLEEIGAKVLDMGCGYGVFGIVVNKLTNASVDMVDVNLRAIHLAKRNVLENKCDNVNVFESNCYEKVTSKYNTIITNPPIRAGKKVIYKIFEEAHDHLNDGGTLWIVIRKNHGAQSAKKFIESIFGNCEIIRKEKGYYILKSIKSQKK